MNGNVSTFVTRHLARLTTVKMILSGLAFQELACFGAFDAFRNNFMRFHIESRVKISFQQSPKRFLPVLSPAVQR